ncbi:hypothetical protein GOB86_13075 [Acetobacter lambici]|uniref:Cation:proton antiporter n=1 Tax=Acetobacter lambici TaxID=1332824 RepID=A0ABT1F3N1_9PROT|nr:hypothetical protein [Acetobacter lambici]MCP1243696.1 hypothetical protein [Acetobacter lambici]MCP1259758.1 hypothetical protein [Acetobacter lambici]NHO57971.1 hypothetical protein [Acetobacter lambici]
MSGLILFAAGGCTLVCGVLLYLSSRHQCIFVSRPNTRLCLSGATGMAALAIFLLGEVEGKASACFMVVLLLMAVCSFFPLLMAMRLSGNNRS